MSTTSLKVQRKIVDQVVNGCTQREIASDLGVSQQAISKSLAKGSARALLEKAYLDLAGMAPKVVVAYSDALTAIPSDLDERKFRLGAAKDVSGMIGLSPVRDSHNNVFFTSIVAPVAVTLSPMVAKLLDRLSDGSVDDDTIDVEYIE